ncbi:MAG: hypothetical protein AABY64_02985 [Bdellovibrionota bacterium]
MSSYESLVTLLICVFSLLFLQVLNIRWIWNLVFLMMIGIPLAQVSAAETVTIDLAVNKGVARNVGTGFLGDISSVNPPASVVDPLKPKMFRGNVQNCFDTDSRSRALGATCQVMLSWGRWWRAPFPGDGGDWTEWLNFVGTTVQTAKNRGLKLHWDIWNEPDSTNYWNPAVGGFNTTAGRDQFHETWTRTVRKIRSIDPNAIIVGPSYAFIGNQGTGLNSFLLYARDHYDAAGRNVLPDILAWHEFEGAEALTRNVSTVHQFMTANGIKIPAISINEYMPFAIPTPAILVSYIAAIQRSGVESASHACWPESEIVTNGGNCGNYSLDGVLTNATQLPRSQWWAYKFYADITGTLVDVTRQGRTDAVAGLNSGARVARILVGGDYKSVTPPTSVDVVVKNISAASNLPSGGKVRVVVQRIANFGKNTMSAPQGLINPDTKNYYTDYTVSSGQIIISLAGYDSNSAYTITLSPPGGVSVPEPTPRAPSNLRVTKLSGFFQIL